MGAFLGCLSRHAHPPIWAMWPLGLCRYDNTLGAVGGGYLAYLYGVGDEAERFGYPLASAHQDHAQPHVEDAVHFVEGYAAVFLDLPEDWGDGPG